MTKTEVFVLRKDRVEHARCPNGPEQMRWAILDQIRRGNITEKNFDDWTICVDDDAGNCRVPTDAELERCNPYF